MNITKEQKDELNAVLKIQVEPEDYKEKVNSVIKDYKKKAKMDGFRPGKVPEGLIRKMYGRAIKVDEVNKLVGEKLSEYIKSEELNILGEPLPNKEEQKPIDWDNDQKLEFAFDIAEAPEFEVKISGHDKVPYYTIQITDDLIDRQVDNYQQRLGEFKPVEQVSDKDEMITADITELNEQGNPKEGGIVKDNTSISLNVIKDEAIKEQFLNAKNEDAIDIDLKKAFPNNTEISSMLNIEKEKAEQVEGMFRIKINEIKKFEKAEVNQELFDKIYGEGNVTSDEELREKIKEELQNHLKPESERKLAHDVKEHFVRKVNPKIPSEFLKRWLKETQNDLSEEDIEKDFDQFERDVKWDLIKNKIAKDNEIKVEESEILEVAKQVTMQQFQQYGLANLPDEQLEQYAKEILKKDEDRRKLYERKYEEKVVEHIKEKVKLEEKEVTSDEFQKLIEEDQNKQSR